MNKLIVLMVCLLVYESQTVFGQQCETKIDAFSNESISSFEWKAGGIRTLYYESTKGTSIFIFRVGEIGTIEYTIPKGSEVLIKTENSEIIKLYTTDDIKSVTSSMVIDKDNNVNFSTYFLKMEVTPEQLRQLASFKVTDIKFPDLYGGTKSYDSKKLRNKFQKYLMEGAKCILDKK